jgi:hypothetical protein
MSTIRLDTQDAIELAGMLQFIKDWLTTSDDVKAAFARGQHQRAPEKPHLARQTRNFNGKIASYRCTSGWTNCPTHRSGWFADTGAQRSIRGGSGSSSPPEGAITPRRALGSMPF